MNVRIRLFASYRELAGTGRIDVTLEPPATVAAAIQRLLQAVPALPRDFRPHLIAVNEDFANAEYPLRDGDEVALYPPVSGGVEARVVHEAIGAGAVADRVRHPGNGAVVTFEGVTRDNTGGRRVRHLEYEAHEAMAEKVLSGVLVETAARFGIDRLAAWHRIGHLEIGDVSLVVAVGSAHRLEAFLATQYAVDRIKHVVPVWKKEAFEDGSVWVGAACDPEHHAMEQQVAPYAGFLAAREGDAGEHAHRHAHAH
ncbi:MAG: hypothetical protein FJ318_04465 [SAR202 cluster bacterium]|nr:hypothetical protein [SAR202 cluster bacterium]